MEGGVPRTNKTRCFFSSPKKHAYTHGRNGILERGAFATNVRVYRMTARFLHPEDFVGLRSTRRRRWAERYSALGVRTTQRSVMRV